MTGGRSSDGKKDGLYSLQKRILDQGQYGKILQSQVQKDKQLPWKRPETEGNKKGESRSLQSGGLQSLRPIILGLVSSAWPMFRPTAVFCQASLVQNLLGNLNLVLLSGTLILKEMQLHRSAAFLIGSNPYNTTYGSSK
jgi:hypothetical protein